MKRTANRDEKWLAENFKTIGFEIYDYMHIFSAITMVVLLLVYWHSLAEAEAQVTLFKEIVFFFMSGFLILFVAYIAENEDPHSERMVYNFCWIIASLILFIPALFDLILFFIKGLDLAANAVIFLTDIASMIFPILSLGFLVLAIFRLGDIKRWLRLMVAGVSFSFFGSLADIAQMSVEFAVEGFSPFLLVEMITAIAPIAPIIFGFHDFHLLHRYITKQEKLIFHQK